VQEAWLRLARSDEAVLADSVGLALLVALETLNPAERLAFVLHDMFVVGRIVEIDHQHRQVGRRLRPGQDHARGRVAVRSDPGAHRPRGAVLAQLATLLPARRGTPAKVIATRNPADAVTGERVAG
jgi:hypothetical protein